MDDSVALYNLNAFRNTRDETDCGESLQLCGITYDSVIDEFVARNH